MKLGVFCMMFTVIIIIMNAGGVQTNSGSLIGNATIVYNFVNVTAINADANSSLSQSGSGVQNVQSTGMWSQLLQILGFSAAVAIVAGLLTNTSPNSILKGTLVSFFGGAFISDMLSIYNKLYDSGIIWVRWVAVLVFASTVIYFFTLLLAWWDGNDG